MKTIPSYIWENSTPENLAEHCIFELLKKTEIGEKAIALHSLNLKGGKKQSWYEIDFLLLTQTCIYGIEVKTGFLSTKEGEWRIHKSNMGVAYSKKKSPYVQAKDATLYWRDNWLFKNFPELKGKISCAYIAALYMNDDSSLREMNSPELPREIVLGQNQFTLEGLKECLERSKRYHTNQSHHNENGISKEKIEFIAGKLRPTVEQSYPAGLTNFLLQSQEQLTEEQYRLLDQLEIFDRLIIDGGAGTGKTFVLAQLVRKETHKKVRTLVLTRPEKLRRKLRSLLSDTTAFITGPRELEAIGKDQFDTLFLDEGQDLCDEFTLQKLDEVLVGGLEKSRWRWFGDFQNQLGNDVEFSQEVFDFLKSMTGNNSVFPLKRNVRNTPNVVRWLEAICHARMGETVMKGAGPEVLIEEESQFYNLLNEVIANPALSGSKNNNVVIIYPRQHQKEFLSSEICKTSSKEKLTYVDSESFKGLESEVVFVWVPKTFNESLLTDYLYKSVSRSRAICFVISNDKKSLIKKAMRLQRKNYE